MRLLDLPMDLFEEVVDAMVDAVQGRTTNLRLVDKLFDRVVTHAIFTRRRDGMDVANNHCLHMPAEFVAKNLMWALETGNAHQSCLQTMLTDTMAFLEHVETLLKRNIKPVASKARLTEILVHSICEHVLQPWQALRYLRPEGIGKGYTRLAFNEDDMVQGTLAIAASLGDIELIELLTAARVSGKAKWRYFSIPLRCAARSGMYDTVTYLLEEGADNKYLRTWPWDTNIKNRRATRSIQRYCRHKDEFVGKILDLKYGWVLSRNKYQQAAFGAFKAGHMALVRYVIGMAICNQSKLLKELFFWAASYREDEMISVLLEEGFDINASTNRADKYGQGWSKQVSALDFAAAAGNFFGAQLLLDRGYSWHEKRDVSREYFFRCHAFNVAVAYGDKEMAQLFLDSGADINFTIQRFRSNGLRMTAIYVAASRNEEMMLRFLASRGADISLGKDAHALLVACERGFKSVVRWLVVEFGLGMNGHLNKRGCLALPIRRALWYGQTEVLELLRELDAKEVQND